MNKTKITFLIVLMSVALLGIIGLQTNWIIHDIRLKEQQFDQGVTLALNDVVNKMETTEAFNLVSDHLLTITKGPGGITMNGDSIQFEIPLAPPVPPVPMGAPEPPEKIDEQVVGGIHVHHETQNGRSRTIISFKSGDNVIETEEEIEGQALAAEVEDSIAELANKAEEKIYLKMQKLNMVMSKMALEFGEQRSDILSRINTGKLDTLIRDELADKGVTAAYDFGIFNRNGDSMIFCNANNHTKDLLATRHKVMLFPNDFYSKPDYLLVSFPNRMNYVLSSLWMMLAGSAIFTLIIIFGFAYTIYVIFRQKKLSDIKTDFINNMTHEFKTPIATISLAVDSIKDPRIYSDPEKISYFTGIIKEENKRMNAQVENVLRMAQLEKGELNLKHEEINIHELIEHSIEAIRLQVLQKEGELITRLEAVNPVLYGDPFHLANVINNLLDNANKYSPDKPLITIHTENTNEGVLIHISDQGMGMTSATQEKIFDKFYRVPTGNIHNIKGFGLGLSYVKAIVESHKGYVSVKSDPGAGSRFSVYIPFHN